ncbi:YolD-like family protein (plasmid) [Staphylococcus warneri]|nr:YolD-like family protein [Staphylococcus warneri]
MNNIYMSETDYRKIPRNKLNPRIPKGRGKIKWMPFASLSDQYEQLEQYIQDQNKKDAPILTEDQLEMMNNTIQFKIYNNEPIHIEYWKQGYFYQHTAYIKEVDLFKQILVLSNHNGNETLSIPLSNIKNIE